MIFILLIICIFLLVAVIVGCWYIFKLRKQLASGSLSGYRKLTEEYENLKEQLNQKNLEYDEMYQITDQLMYFKEDIQKKIPKFDDGSDLIKLNDLYTFWNDFYAGEQFFLNESPQSKDFFRSLRNGLKDADSIEKMQQNVTEPFSKKLSQKKMEPLEVREMLVRMAMQLFDVVEYTSPNSRLVEQGLNKSVVERDEDVSEEEANSKEYAKAKEITDLEDETTVLARNLADALEGLGLDDKKLILSGYKFTGKPGKTTSRVAEEKGNLIPEENDLTV